MDAMFYLFAAAVGTAAVLAAIAIWSPRATWIRVAALVVTALIMPLAYAQMTTLLSKPKPFDFAWFERNVERAAVLGVSLHEGKAIYLWLRLDDATEPGYYMLPWRQRIAENLDDAIDGALNSRSGVMLEKPFSRRAYEELGQLNVKIVPPPVLPQKKPPPPPRLFNPRSKEI
jgi:hypothetical protein